MEWKDEFSVGVAIIDQDHKELLRIVNALSEALAKGPQPAGRICDELIEHTLAHFTREEHWFKPLGYPGAEQHRRMHQKLTERLLEYRDRLRQETDADRLALFVDFLAHHITGADRSYGAWLNTRGIH